MSDGRLHQRGAGKKQSAAVRHEYVITHHGQIAAAGNAHTHDGRNLGNTHGRHDGVIAKDAAKIIRVRENVFLKREKNSGRID